MNSIIFAGGCFWGVQGYFKNVKGVLKTAVGYTGGFYKFPTYSLVCSGITGHAESCKVDYDPDETELEYLLEHFFYIIDPTSVNRQGNDVGEHYRTAIYYYDPNEKQRILNFIKNAQNNYESPIVVEVEPAGDFWEAEDYHQDYLDKNPNGYCHIGKAKMSCASRLDLLVRK